LLISPLIDSGDFRDPALAFTMLERKDLVMRPVKVIRDVRYLLEQSL
jgi:hypothetical protein